MKSTPFSLSRLAIGLAAGALLAGCSKSENASSSAAAPATASSATAAPKQNIVVGFVQTGHESGWRVANTNSMEDAAKAAGITLKFVDCQGDSAMQIKAAHDFITQKVDAIVIAPIVLTGWDQTLKDAKDAGIPVIIEDRNVEADPSLYSCFIGSNFVKEGEMAADWLIKHTGGKGNILEISGTPGSDPAVKRHDAFVNAIKGTDLKIIDSQSGNFDLGTGKTVMEAMLKAHPKGTFDIVYAHNDDMALGAVQAIEEAGLKPGVDVIVVSIDGEKRAVQNVADGKENCVVECNPMIGPQVMATVKKVLAGETVPKVTYSTDHVFDSTNAAQEAPKRPYN